MAEEKIIEDISLVKKYYSVKPTASFPVDTGKNFIIDLPVGEWGKTAVVRSSNWLEEGDMIRLPNGFWLEVKRDEGRSFGYSGTNFGRLEVIEHSDNIEKEICDKKAAGNIYSTIATYIS